MKNFCLLTLSLILFTYSFAVAQDSDSTRDYKNVVKVNLSSQVLYSKAFVLSYERKLKPDQTFSIQGGYLEFPTIISGSSDIVVKKNNEKNGFMVGADYRFYLLSENRHKAPRGIYVGPYISYYSFNNKRLADLPTENPDNDPTIPDFREVELDSKIHAFNVGAMLGYQFIIKKRISIDMVLIGPSLSNYSAKFDINGDLSNVAVDDQLKKFVEALSEKFPGLKDLLKDKEVTLNGTNTAWSAGFRYSVSVGFRF